MKKAIIGVLALMLAIVGTLFLFAWESPGAAGPPAPNQSGPALRDPSTLVQAHARVVPQNSVMLSFPAKGIVPEGFVGEVLVKPGMMVEKGALLARLDTRNLELQIE